MQQSGIGPASRLEGKARRIEAATPQTLFKSRVGVEVTGQVDPLLVIKVRRHLGLINPNQRHDNFLTHQPRGVDLRLAPRRRQPFCRDERQHHLAEALCRLLQSVFPALAGHNAALRVEIEEDIVPAVFREPVTDLDSLVVVALE